MVYYFVLCQSVDDLGLANVPQSRTRVLRLAQHI